MCVWSKLQLEKEISKQKMQKKTCCFPSIAVENVKVTVFFPSFKFKDASCSDVGVSALNILFTTFGLSTFLSPSLQVVLSEAFSAPETLASFGAGCIPFLDFDLLKEKGQILQLPPGDALNFDGSPERGFSTWSTAIMPFGSNICSFPNKTIPNTIWPATSHGKYQPPNLTTSLSSLKTRTWRGKFIYIQFYSISCLRSSISPPSIHTRSACKEISLHEAQYMWLSLIFCLWNIQKNKWNHSICFPLRL